MSVIVVSGLQLQNSLGIPFQDFNWITGANKVICAAYGL